MLKPALLALGAVAMLAACEPVPGEGGSAASAADPLSGTWRIRSIGGTKVEDEFATSMTFTGLTTVSGTFGCSQFTGNYTYDRNVVFVTNVTPPTAQCTGAAERQDRNGRRLISMPMTVVADPSAAILSGREGQSFALHR